MLIEYSLQHHPWLSSLYARKNTNISPTILCNVQTYHKVSLNKKEASTCYTSHGLRRWHRLGHCGHHNNHIFSLRSLYISNIWIVIEFIYVNRRYRASESLENSFLLVFFNNLRVVRNSERLASSTLIKCSLQHHHRLSSLYTLCSREYEPLPHISI
jgi:hypothetical protein